MIASLKPHSAYLDSGLTWALQIPAHWTIRRAKSQLSVLDIRTMTGREELLSVSSARGVIPRSTATVTMFKAKSYIGYKLCWPQDLVVNSLWAWGGGLGVSGHHGIVSTAYSVYRLRPLAELTAPFLHQLVRSAPFQWELQVRSNGVWKSRLQLTDEALLDAPVLIPPPSEQAAIVKYLIWATARIDRAIRSKKKIIALLNEQKQAIIHQAVTRGIDPGVRLKPSGISWLGEIPEHWNIVRNLALFAHSVKPGIADLPVLQVSLRYGITSESLDQFGRPKKLIEDPTKYKRVYRGDIAYNTMRMWQGAVGVAPFDGLVSPAYVVLRPRDGVCSDFYDLVFRTNIYMHQVNRESTGIVSDRNRLYWDRFKQMPNVALSYAEQMSIVAHVSSQTSGLERAQSVLESEIAVLLEYRTRLVSDVVTGKVDVREAAATLPDELVTLEGNESAFMDDVADDLVEELDA
jgi:type I restriction enzyme, S subunit